jgi:hypothetical protein
MSSDCKKKSDLFPILLDLIQLHKIYNHEYFAQDVIVQHHLIWYKILFVLVQHY